MVIVPYIVQHLVRIYMPLTVGLELAHLHLLISVGDAPPVQSTRMKQRRAVQPEPHDMHFYMACQAGRQATI